MCSIMGFTSPKLTAEAVQPYFERTKSRGPDDTRIEQAGSGCLCFHRLAINSKHRMEWWKNNRRIIEK